MLFLLRPPQTYMPFAGPRNRTEQAAYNRQLQDRFESTRRVAPAHPRRPGAILWRTWGNSESSTDPAS